MYIWVAIDVENQLQEQKKIAKEIEEKTRFNQSNISLLPMHISLKISAEVAHEHEAELRNDIQHLFKITSPFSIEVENIELNGTIVWIKMKENEELKELHTKLCHIYSKYQLALHEYDYDFTYHSTLFIDDDVDKINEAYYQIKNMALPKSLVANKFVIGSSPEGKIGTYSVDTVIECNG